MKWNEFSAEQQSWQQMPCVSQSRKYLCVVCVSFSIALEQNVLEMAVNVERLSYYWGFF